MPKTSKPQTGSYITDKQIPPLSSRCSLVGMTRPDADCLTYLRDPSSDSRRSNFLKHIMVYRMKQEGDAFTASCPHFSTALGLH